MNKRQKITKHLAKRAKARLNKVDPQSIAKPDAVKKDRYISKAERAKLAAAEALNQTEVETATQANEAE